MSTSTDQVVQSRNYSNCWTNWYCWRSNSS